MIEETEESNFCCDKFVEKLSYFDSMIMKDLEIAKWKCKACKNETWIYSKIEKFEIYSDGKLIKEKFISRNKEKLI